jgi:hypothetical protein
MRKKKNRLTPQINLLKRLYHQNNSKKSKNHKSHNNQKSHKNQKKGMLAMLPKALKKSIRSQENRKIPIKNK